MGIGITFDGCGEARSSKISWVSCRACCCLGPLLPGGDGRKGTGRSGTGRTARAKVSDTKDSVSTVWAVEARNDC